MILLDDTDKMSMGEYEEHYALCNSQPPKPTATVWVTREGRQIAVTAMTDSHLTNTIRMLRRKAPFVQLMIMDELRQMDRYIAGAPDGAAMACEAEAAALGDMTDDEYLNRHFVTLPAMLAEAEKRGLEL